MRFFWLPLFLFITSFSCGKSFLPMDTLKKYPNEIDSLVGNEIQFVICVDFTGDSLNDYIVRKRTDSYGSYRDYWITSRFELFLEFEENPVDINYFWLINLDSDPEPEIYVAVGFEDGIDYAIYDIDTSTKTINLMFHFSPVILSKKNNLNCYWGYPWDVRGVVVDPKNETLLHCSTIDSLTRDGVITYPKNQSRIPIIFLDGKNDENEHSIGDFPNREWKTLHKLRKAVITGN